MSARDWLELLIGLAISVAVLAGLGFAAYATFTTAVRFWSGA